MARKDMPISQAYPLNFRWNSVTHQWPLVPATVMQTRHSLRFRIPVSKQADASRPAEEADNLALRFRFV
jgi:hypothetical protein